MLNPITAVTALDPYSYYAELVKQKPLYYDDTLSMWIASGSEIVESILINDFCMVRPAAEPIPNYLRETTAGLIFRHLVRMNDGGLHCPLKKAVAETFEQINRDSVGDESAKRAEILFDNFYQLRGFRWITDYALRLPVCAMARLLGIGENNLGEIYDLMSAFVHCIAPGGTAEQIEKGKLAAQNLYEIFEKSFSEANDNIFSSLNRQLDKYGISNREIAVANAIGLLFQTYEATAGLIGNSLVSLASRPKMLEQIKLNPKLLPNVIDETNRFDPAVQNTRRFVAASARIGGEKMKSGDVILVVLAAANQDSRANREPEVFDIYRTSRRSFTFGAGAHACPGQNLAFEIAEAGLRKLIFSKVEIARTTNNIRYRNSVNTRIPVFSGE